MVSIAAFQAVDPGSIPGHRRLFFCSHTDNKNLRSINLLLNHFFHYLIVHFNKNKENVLNFL